MNDSHPFGPVAALPRRFHRPVEHLETCVRAPLVPNRARPWAGLPDVRLRLLAAVGEGAGMGSLAGAGSVRKARR